MISYEMVMKAHDTFNLDGWKGPEWAMQAALRAALPMILEEAAQIAEHQHDGDVDDYSMGWDAAATRIATLLRSAATQEGK